MQYKIMGESYRNSACADFDGKYTDIVTIRSQRISLPANVNILFNDGQGNFLENPITSIPTSNPELQTSNLSCYPNPFTTKTTIETNDNKLKMIKIETYDLEWQFDQTFTEKMLFRVCINLYGMVKA
ncbi:MAG: hypothetical protein R2764_15680 [Bacteroidales bacterium]